jgi:hypothetical protein
VEGHDSAATCIPKRGIEQEFERFEGLGVVGKALIVGGEVLLLLGFSGEFAVKDVPTTDIEVEIAPYFPVNLGFDE